MTRRAANSQDVLLRAFRGETTGTLNQFNVSAADTTAGTPQTGAVKAAREAIAELGPDTSTWSEPVEVVHFNHQGAGDVPDYGPLQNRGSYGQVIEPLAHPLAVDTAPNVPRVLPNTSGSLYLAWILLAGLVVASALLSFGRPARE